jgi:hypothetical protein
MLLLWIATPCELLLQADRACPEDVAPYNTIIDMFTAVRKSALKMCVLTCCVETDTLSLHAHCISVGTNIYLEQEKAVIIKELCFFTADKIVAKAQEVKGED